MSKINLETKIEAGVLQGKPELQVTGKPSLIPEGIVSSGRLKPGAYIVAEGKFVPDLNCPAMKARADAVNKEIKK